MFMELKIYFAVLVILIGVNCDQFSPVRAKYTLKCEDSEDGRQCSVIVPPPVEQITEKRGEQAFFKRLFEKVLPPIAYKANDISCLTDDCDIQTLKIRRLDKKMNRNVPNNFACVGNPYTDSGSKCYPIEGLYIG